MLVFQLPPEDKKYVNKTKLLVMAKLHKLLLDYPIVPSRKTVIPVKLKNL